MSAFPLPRETEQKKKPGLIRKVIDWAKHRNPLAEEQRKNKGWAKLPEAEAADRFRLTKGSQSLLALLEFIRMKARRSPDGEYDLQVGWTPWFTKEQIAEILYIDPRQVQRDLAEGAISKETPLNLFEIEKSSKGIRLKERPDLWPKMDNRRGKSDADEEAPEENQEDSPEEETSKSQKGRVLLLRAPLSLRGGKTSRRIPIKQGTKGVQFVNDGDGAVQLASYIDDGWTTVRIRSGETPANKVIELDSSGRHPRHIPPQAEQPRGAASSARPPRSDLSIPTPQVQLETIRHLLKVNAVIASHIRKALQDDDPDEAELARRCTKEIEAFVKLKQQEPRKKPIGPAAYPSIAKELVDVHKGRCPEEKKPRGCKNCGAPHSRMSKFGPGCMVCDDPEGFVGVAG